MIPKTFSTIRNLLIVKDCFVFFIWKYFKETMLKTIDGKIKENIIIQIASVLKFQLFEQICHIQNTINDKKTNGNTAEIIM